MLFKYIRMKFNYIFIVLLAFNAISRSSSMSLAKGGLPEGDPAPGRSPGPPKFEEVFQELADTFLNVSDDKVETKDIVVSENAGNIPADNSEIALRTINLEDSDDTVIYEVDKVQIDPIKEEDKVVYQVDPELGDRPLTIDPCDYAYLADNDPAIVNLDHGDSEVRLSVVHSVFETEELVKGVVYGVTIQMNAAVRDYVISSLINGEERGEFTAIHPINLCHSQKPIDITKSNTSNADELSVRTKNSDDLVNIVDNLVLKIVKDDGDKVKLSDSEILRDKRDVIARTLNSKRQLRTSTVVGGSRLDRKQIVFKWILKDSKLHEKTANKIIFRLRYRNTLEDTIYQLRYEKFFRLDCQISVRISRTGRISSTLIPQENSCRIQLPPPSSNYALLLQLIKFNVPCRTGGFIRFESTSAPLCGKLEELALSSRKHYYNATTKPSIHLHGKPYFLATFRIVDACFNMLYTENNGSFHVGPSESLKCLYTIHLPYGYKVALRLQMTKAPINSTSILAFDDHQPDKSCDGMLILLKDGDKTWRHCSQSDDPLRSVQIVSSQNNISISITISKTSRTGIGSMLDVWWTSDPVVSLVGQCTYGWIWSEGVCMAAFRDAKKQWRQAEAECVRNGGQLLAVRNLLQQRLVDEMLLNSPKSGADEVYWIGATDFVHEGDFRWSNGIPFSFSHWYPGGHLKGRSQPNDDGLSRQDCVEIRRHFPERQPTATYMWNDRACHEHNYYICERPLSIEPYPGVNLDCNETIRLSTTQPSVTINSPGFPRQYPDNSICIIDISAPPSYVIHLDFEEFVLENEMHCSYDFLEIIHYDSHNTSLNPDFYDLEKPSTSYHNLIDLFHFENESTEESGSLIIHSDELSSGFSKNFTSGVFVKRQCGDWTDKLKLLRYASSGSRVQIRFQTDYSHHYVGFKAKISMSNAASCADPRFKLYNGYCYLFVGYPKVSWNTAQQVCDGLGAHLSSVHGAEEQSLISNLIRNSPDYNSGEIYWLGAQVHKINDTRRLTSWSDGTEVMFEAWSDEDSWENLEELSCLGLQWKRSSKNFQWSGLHWTSEKCSKIGGYICKQHLSPINLNRHLNRTIFGTNGNISSSNFPFGYEHNLDYWIEIVAPESTRILIVFHSIELEFQKHCLYDYVEVTDSDNHTKIRRCGTVTIPTHWVSKSNKAFVHFVSDYSIGGKGFLLTWKSVDMTGCPEQTLTAKEGNIVSPNYPDWLLPNLDCTWNIMVPTGKRVFLNISHLDFGKSELTDDMFNNTLEIVVSEDEIITPYSIENLLSDGLYISKGEVMKMRLKTGITAEGVGFSASYKTVSAVEERRTIEVPPGGGKVRHVNYPLSPVKKIRITSWLRAPPYATISLSLAGLAPALLEDSQIEPCGAGKGWIEVFDHFADENGTQWYLCESNTASPFEINSFLHTVTVTQCGTASGIHLDLTVRIKDDPEYLSKLLQLPEDIGPEYCFPEPCLNNGYCALGKEKNYCKCSGFYTGPFCALTACERSPCVFGNCSLSAEAEGGWTCNCADGWGGRRCAVRRRACDVKPCQGRGACRNTPHGFICKCNPTWKGTRCEIRDMQIRFKPLSERMLQEPFWLGLITVFVVMGVIGLVWCAKRHFPEKLEKLLAEEADRCTKPHPGGKCCGPPIRIDGSGNDTAPRRLLTRLIRKPSTRACSLDDLLRPPRRTPSPRKKRNNSTPSKKNGVDKTKILQQLISPAEGGNENSPPRPRRVLAAAESAPAVCTTSEASRSPDPRLEKKVTFARLLSRVSAEMSSGSEDNGRGPRAASTPPSPGVEIRSATSSLDFGEATLRRQARSPKISSADSILAMFRSFSAAGASRASSTVVSVSTTPTASSPQDDTGCEEDSLASSAYAYSAGYESPAGGPIEVRVVESGRGSAGSGDLLHPPSILLEVPTSSLKCLSPIRELPTPLPSPALTPIMPRSRIASCASAESCGGEESIELPVDDDDNGSSSRPESSASSIVKLRPSALSSLSAETSSWSISPASPAPPLLTLQRPSPGSPPPRPRRSLPALDGPPLITITFGEPESDEPPSPAARVPMPNMCYLSPFSVVARSERAPSESNLSSSGYSSMASPGPSRCSSSNPLCPSEAEDPGSGGSRTTPPNRRRRLLSKTDSAPSTTSTVDLNDQTSPERKRSDSETFSDEPPLESTDEGVGTDRRPSDSIEATIIEIPVPTLSSPTQLSPPTLDKCEKPLEIEKTMACLRPPSIVIGNENDRPLSSASSRSESPTSERAGVGRISPHFYGGNRDQLPFTDSDGLYDFPSSECTKEGSVETSSFLRKSSTRRRKKSPAKVSASPPSLLVVPGKELRTPIQRKIGLRKQRSRASRPVSSSSSSESVRSAQSARSVQSARDLRIFDKSDQSLDTIGWQEWPHDDQKKSKSPLRQRKLRKRRAKTQEDITTKNSSNIDIAEEGRGHTKISRLRSISNQIRFLKRLEQSLKGKGRLTAPSDDEGDESSSVTSPLLHMTTNADESPRTRTLHKAVSLQEDITTPLIHKTTSLPTNITSPLLDSSKLTHRNRFQKPVRGLAVDEMYFNDLT